MYSARAQERESWVAAIHQGIFNSLMGTESSKQKHARVRRSLAYTLLVLVRLDAH